MRQVKILRRLISVIADHLVSLSAHVRSSVAAHYLEPAHDKTYNKTCVTIKDSNQPAHPPSEQGFSFIYLWIVQKAHGISEDSDQIALMHRLICVFARRTSLIVGFAVRWPNFLKQFKMCVNESVSVTLFQPI